MGKPKRGRREGTYNRNVGGEDPAPCSTHKGQDGKLEKKVGDIRSQDLKREKRIKGEPDRHYHPEGKIPSIGTGGPS